jgi:hypothetical protein
LFTAALVWPQVLLAGVKRNALELRQKELDFNVERFTNLATQASVIAGFSFESLVELEVPEETNWILSSTYFVFGSSAMALSLYCLVISSFACVFGHRLALQGPHGSLERAVQIMVAHRVHIFAVGGASLACLVVAAMLMAWIKMGAAATVVTLIFIGFFAAVSSRMHKLLHLFEIPELQLVTGAVQVNAPHMRGAAVDLARLNPGNRAASKSVRASDRGAYAYQALRDEQRTRSSAGTLASVGSGRHASSCGHPSERHESLALHHEGHLFKKGEPGLMRKETTKRRYFVLKGTKLYYFKAWEDFGSAGFHAATNASTPIDMLSHEPVVLPDSPDGPNRFDLLPVDDPLARKWELQAPTAEELKDWLAALRVARALAKSSGNQITVCAPNVLMS